MALVALLLTCVLAAPPPEPSLRLVAVGDVLLARTVPQRIAEHGPAWLWAPIASLLADADLRFANLECPVTVGGTPVPKPFCFRGEPEQVEAVLRTGGIDIVSVANNHTFDYGREGLRQTLANLLRWGLAAPGAGQGRAGAVRPVIVERGGLKLGFVAYTDWPPEDYLPAEDDACLATLDESTLANEVAAARAQVDRLVVSVHWGQEYRATASDRQKQLGHALVDAGADLVLGHHPHVAQPVETYRERPIVYSLGNCIFDRSGPKVSNGLVVTIRMGASGVTVERVVATEPRECRPQPTGSPQ
ncbi:MAG: CapA family protein [Armatimonadetes bacterium]|nr:CapA family protein [Armatimonadota bacterium]